MRGPAAGACVLSTSRPHQHPTAPPPPPPQGNALFLDQFREQALPGTLAPLEALLSKQDYLLKGGFSAADVAVGAYLIYVPAMLADKVDLSPYPAILAYMDRLRARPECCLPGGPKGRAA